MFKRLWGIEKGAKWVLMEKIVLLIAAQKKKKSDSLFRPDMFLETDMPVNLARLMGAR